MCYCVCYKLLQIPFQIPPRLGLGAAKMATLHMHMHMHISLHIYLVSYGIGLSFFEAKQKQATLSKYVCLVCQCVCYAVRLEYISWGDADNKKKEEGCNH